MNLYFYNHYNCGDVHFARQFVKDIMNKVKYEKCFFSHKLPKGLLKDIKEIEEIDLLPFMDANIPVSSIEDNTYINTWIGQENMVYAYKGLGLKLHYVMFEKIYNKLGIKLEKDIEYYHPTIDYNYVNKEGVDEFLSDKKGLKVLINNGYPNSGQSIIYSMNPIIFTVAKTFKDVTFILTKKDGLGIENVFYTDDFTGESMDIMEISYLSTFCDVIIGRSTSPYGACNVRDNIKDPNKVFISFCNPNLSWYPEGFTKYVWSGTYDPNSITSIILREIKEKINKTK